MKKIKLFVSLFLLINTSATSCFAFTRSILIPSGTPVNIYLENEIDADNVKKYDIVNFVVQDNLKIDNKIMIKSGTKVQGQIINKKNNFILGLAGEIQIGNFLLFTEDNQQIYLRGIMQNKGIGREWVNIGWFFLFPLLFIKGEDGKINAGSCQTLYTINDVVLYK